MTTFTRRTALGAAAALLATFGVVLVVQEPQLILMQILPPTLQLLKQYSHCAPEIHCRKQALVTHQHTQ